MKKSKIVVLVLVVFLCVIGLVTVLNLVFPNYEDTLTVSERVQLTLDARAQSEPTATEKVTPVPDISDPLPLAPTATPEPTATLQFMEHLEKGCTDIAEFYDDVTIPDGYKIPEGTTFVKTWRFRNVGTCTWTPEYGMIDEVVYPDEFVNVSISLNTSSFALPIGYYGETSKLFFQLYDENGQDFEPTGNYNQSFYVVIDVVPSYENILIVPSKKVSVDMTGGRHEGLYVGDFANGLGVQAIIRLPLTQIQSHATLNSVSLGFPYFEVKGNPFNYGCIGIHEGDYFDGEENTIYSNDYWYDDTDNSEFIYLEYCNKTSLSKWKHVGGSFFDLIEKAIAEGKNYIELKFTFGNHVWPDYGLDDYVWLDKIELWLNVSY